MRVKKRVFQAEGAACAKALRREGVWYSLGMEMAGGTHGAWQETKLAVGGRQGLTKVKGSWTSLAVQWLGIHASTAGGTGSIPGRGTKILRSGQCSQKKKKKVKGSKQEVKLCVHKNSE